MTTSEKSSDNKSVLKIIADYDCEVIVDKKKSISVNSNSIHRIGIRKGKYMIEASPNGYPQLSLNKIYVMEDNAMEDILEIKLKDLVLAQKDRDIFIENLVWDFGYIEDRRTGVKIALAGNMLIKCRFGRSQYFKVLKGAIKVNKEREEFQEIIGYTSFFYTGIEGGTTGVVDAFGSSIIDCIYKDVKYFGNAFIVQNFDDLWMLVFIDEMYLEDIPIYYNRCMLENTYQDCADYIEGSTIIPLKNKDGKWGAIDFQGRVIIDFKYDGVIETDKYYAFGQGCEVYKTYNDYEQSYNYKELKCSQNGSIQRYTLNGGIIEKENWMQVIISSERYDYPMWVDANGVYHAETMDGVMKEW